MYDVCICIYVLTWMCVCMCMYLHVYTYMCVFVCVCIYSCIYKFLHECVSMYAPVYIYMPICILLYESIPSLLWLYLYPFIYTHLVWVYVREHACMCMHHRVYMLASVLLHTLPTCAFQACVPELVSWHK